MFALASLACPMCGEFACRILAPKPDEPHQILVQNGEIRFRCLNGHDWQTPCKVVDLGADVSA